MIAERRKSRKREWVRNSLFTLFAIGVVVIFFNLDIMRKGESVFSRTAENKLNFSGDMTRKHFKDSEVEQLLKYIRVNKKLIESFTIETSLDDSYKKITNTTQVAFSIHMVMSDGTKISTPTRRATRKKLVSAIFAKVKKDMRVYRKLLKEGKKVKSLVNTM